MQGGRAFLPVLGALSVLLILVALPGGGARAATTRVVTTLVDGEPGSLRQRIAESGPDDRITFAAGLTGILVLTGGEMGIGQNLTIAGPAARDLVLDAASRSRFLTVGQGVNVTVSGLAFTHGRVVGTQGGDSTGTGTSGGPGGDAFGGAIFNRGTLRLVNCVLKANSVQGGNGGNSDAAGTVNGRPLSGGSAGRGLGGAVFNEGVLTLERCSLSDNTAAGGDGGVDTASAGGFGGGGGGGAVSSFGTSLSFLNCTLARNHSIGGTGGTGGPEGGGSGGIAYGAIHDLSADGTFVNCTVAGNDAQGGQGGDSVGPSNGGRAKGGAGGFAQGGGLLTGLNAHPTATGCLIALNEVRAGGGGTGPDGSSSGVPTDGPDVSNQRAISIGYNLIGKTDGSVGWSYPDRTGDAARPLDPLLQVVGGGLPAVQDNGGASETIALRAGSPALDGGNDAVLGAPYHLTTDQRGLPRRMGAAVDMGAFEFEPPGAGLVVTTLHDHDDGVPGAVDCTLREALGAANAASAPRTLTFRAGLAGTVTLLYGELVITRSMTLQGPGARVLALSGRGTRILRIPSGAVSLSGLTLRNGFAFGTPNAQGGGILNAGALTLTACTLAVNRASGQTTLPGTPGGEAQGAAIYNQGTLFLTDCTLSDNVAAGALGASDPNNQGGTGGAARGGAVCNRGNLTVTNCTFSINRAIGGPGGTGFIQGNGGPGQGGAIWSSNPVTLTNVTVASNSAQGGFPFGAGSGGGLSLAGSSTLRNTLVALNAADTAGPDVSGGVSSQGTNLIGKTDGSSGWRATDRTGTGQQPLDPRLGPLATNGGPTNTHALQAGSPAINAGNDSLAPPRDQRGFAREGVSDIGAFEAGGAAPFAPLDVSVSPSGGASGVLSTLVFTARYSDQNGAADLASAYFLMNTSTSGAGGLYAWYDAVSNKLYLRNNANTAWLGGFAPGSANRITDSAGRGTLNCGQTTVSRSGNVLTVAWSLTANASFTGAKNVYLSARDRAGAADGPDRLGAWTLTTGPSNLGVSPASGASATGVARTVTATYTDPNGAADVTEARLLVNSTPGGGSALYGYYDARANKLYLRNNANTAWLGGFAPGTANPIQDPSGQGKGTLNCGATRVTRNGNTLTITWTFTPATAFTGTKNLYLFVKDASGLSDGLESLGTWTIQ